MMPIFTMERVEGRIFRPVALTYAFALAGALLFTLTTVPALTTALLKRRQVRHVHSPVLAWLEARYLAGLRATTARPLAVGAGGGWRWWRWRCCWCRASGRSSCRR